MGDFLDGDAERETLANWRAAVVVRGDIRPQIRPQRAKLKLYSSENAGSMGEISVILVENNFFMLLHKFNLHNLIYDSLKFQNFITVVQSFIGPYVNFFAI